MTKSSRALVMIFQKKKTIIDDSKKGPPQTRIMQWFPDQYCNQQHTPKQKTHTNKISFKTQQNFVVDILSLLPTHSSLSLSLCSTSRNEKAINKSCYWFDATIVVELSPPLLILLSFSEFSCTCEHSFKGESIHKVLKTSYWSFPFHCYSKAFEDWCL